MGQCSQAYSYEPYGEVSATGLSDNPYQYTGRENDQSGLYYYHACYYSPTLKRFISEDPAGLEAGLNGYAYVGDDPVDEIDPTGLEGIGP
jgi:RHS repeat-associated protein